MAKPKGEEVRKKPSRKRVKLYDGTVIEGDDNSIKNVKTGSQGVEIYDDPVDDPEVVSPEPQDEYSNLQYPPPKKDPLFRRKWASFHDSIVERSNFKIAHLDTLEILCDLHVDLEHLNQFIRTHGMTYRVKTVAGEVRRNYPEVAQRNKIRENIKAYTQLLGLFPAKDSSPKSGDPRGGSEWE